MHALRSWAPGQADSEDRPRISAGVGESELSMSSLFSPSHISELGVPIRGIESLVHEDRRMSDDPWILRGPTSIAGNDLEPILSQEALMVSSHGR
jgi:hypothetical protein